MNCRCACLTQQFFWPFPWSSSSPLCITYPPLLWLQCLCACWVERTGLLAEQWQGSPSPPTGLFAIVAKPTGSTSAASALQLALTPDIHWTHSQLQNWCYRLWATCPATTADRQDDGNGLPCHCSTTRPVRSTQQAQKQCNAAKSSSGGRPWEEQEMPGEGPKRSVCLFARLQVINCHKQSK